MRAIKFRAWDDEHQKWVYFSLGQLLLHYDTDQLHSEKEDLAWICASRKYEFTGLLDKNGREIYEGDIVEASTGNCVVVWQDHTASFAFGMKGWMYNHFIEEMGEIAVIGNIHENPELICRHIIRGND